MRGAKGSEIGEKPNAVSSARQQLPHLRVGWSDVNVGTDQAAKVLLEARDDVPELIEELLRVIQPHTAAFFEHAPYVVSVSNTFLVPRLAALLKRIGRDVDMPSKNQLAGAQELVQLIHAEPGGEMLRL